jgi:hypothetical protein
MSRKYLLLVPVVLLICSSLPFPAASAAGGSKRAPPPSEPAAWRSYNFIVDLHDLPRRYSCDDLWYKFHDVLVALGARADLKVLPYRCERQLTPTTALSPRVQLKFALPEAVGGTQARWADMRAVPRRVRLEPGHPTSLADGDCVLLRQIKDGLLASLSLSQRVVSFDLACTAPRSSRWPFNVTVQALQPADGTPHVAQVAARPNQPLASLGSH